MAKVSIAGQQIRRANRSRRPSLLRSVLVSLAIAAALALLLEGLARGISRLRHGEWPQTRSERFHTEMSEVLRLYQPHPFLNTYPAAGVTIDAFGKRASFNGSGYRSPERPIAKQECATRVLVAGGSTTFDLLAASNRETWPARLEAALRPQFPRVEVWNAGFPGWTSLENGVSWMLRDADLAPDVVILFQGINDLQPASLEPVDRQYRRHASLARTAAGFDLPPLSWLDRSVLLEALRDRLGDPTDPWSRMQSPYTGERRAHLPAEGLEVFERNVRSWVDLAAARGAEVVLMTQFLRVRGGAEEDDLQYLRGWIPGLEPESAAGELERLNDVLRRIGSDRDLLIVDAAGEPWNDGDFGDPMHLTAAGSERLALRVADALRRGAAEALRSPCDPEADESPGGSAAQSSGI